MSNALETVATGLIRVTGAIVLVSFGAMAISTMLTLIVGDGTGTGFRIATSGATLAGCGGLALAAATGLRMRRHVTLMWTVIAASAVAAVTFGVFLWSDRLSSAQDALLSRLGGTMVVVCLVSMHYVAFGDLETDSRPLHWARWVLIAVAWAFAVLVVLMTWLLEAMESIVPTGVLIGFVFVVAAFGVVTGIGSLLLRIVFRLDSRHRRARRESMPSRVTLDLVCPRCRAELTLPAGAGRCPGCNFGVTIEIEEPRCECGYLLYRLQGEMCPECGVVVGTERRIEATKRRSEATKRLSD